MNSHYSTLPVIKLLKNFQEMCTKDILSNYAKKYFSKINQKIYPSTTLIIEVRCPFISECAPHIPPAAQYNRLHTCLNRHPSRSQNWQDRHLQRTLCTLIFSFQLNEERCPLPPKKDVHCPLHFHFSEEPSWLTSQFEL